MHGTQLSGRLGVYDFARNHNINKPFPGNPTQDPDANYNLRALAAGGNLYAETGMVYGLSAAAGVSFSEALRDKDNLNPNLVGPKGHYRTLNRAYLQFNLSGLRVRAGRQNIHTPFVSDDQFGFIPRSFAGFSIAADPIALATDAQAPKDDFGTGKTVAGSATRQRLAPVAYDNDLLMPLTFAGKTQAHPKWRVYFARMYKFERRTSDHFQDGNRYTPNTSGFYTLGTHIRQDTGHGDYIGQVWHYNFNGTADLQYVEGGYQLPALWVSDHFDGIKPYARLQYVHETEAGVAKLGPIDAEVYGAKLGVRTSHVGLSLVGHYAPVHADSFRGGQVAHPYTDLSGLFYTDTINDGVGDLGPGFGYGVRLDGQASDNISVFSRYVRYRARFGQSHDFYDVSGPQGFAANTPITRNQDSWGWDSGFTYDFGALSDRLAGLQIQDTLGITDFHGSHKFFDNRFRLFYKF